MKEMTCRLKEYIQPFERRLALQELRALTMGEVVPENGDEAAASRFTIRDGIDAQSLRSDLAYWRSIGDETDGLTEQLRWEATADAARRRESLRYIEESTKTTNSPNIPARRCLRYGTHGVHEYRGKFFPQLVKALINIAGVPRSGLVVDPMCGSGTTLVEAISAGRTCYGLDMNPLSALISDVKCTSLSLAPKDLIDGWRQLSSELEDPARADHSVGYRRRLNETDGRYLSRWFPEGALTELDQILAAIATLGDRRIRHLYRVCLSNILREVSCQKVDDLRVRREEKTFDEGQAIARFIREAGRTTRTVGLLLVERDGVGLGTHRVMEGDARRATKTLADAVGRTDAIITSPPYATALPYIDTDRLNLIYLGLLPRDGHRRRDVQMIGNREVTTTMRRGYWQFYTENKAKLPAETRALVERIDTLNRETAVGFRRRNLAALLAKYFFDMRIVIHQMTRLLRVGGSLFVVIGNNRTTAGGEAVEINTANHLSNLGQRAGLHLVDDISMDMLVSRDIFKKNAVRSERILRFEKR